MGGWGAYAYSSWSAGRTERALQSQIARLSADRGGSASGSASAQRPPWQDSAAPRTVYPSPEGASPSTPTQVTAASPTSSTAAAAQPSAPGQEPSTASQDTTRVPITEPATTQPP